MTGLASDGQSERRIAQQSRLEEGIVLSTSETNSNLSEHTVKVATPSSGQIEAEVLVGAGGDFYLPPVESRVTIAYFRNDTPAVIGCEYKDLDIERLPGGERRIGHPTTNSHILLSNDGSITIELDDGTTVTLNNSTLTLNGGSTPVVTDINVTKDADGYVTDVTPVTDDSIQL